MSTKIEKIVELLNKSLGNKAMVVVGWTQGIKDFTIPVVTATSWDYWLNHLEIDIWAYTIKDRDQTAEMVVKALKDMKNLGVIVYNVVPIRSEEEGQIQLGTWKPIKRSKPIFRTLIEANL